MPPLSDFTADSQETLSFARQEAPLLHHDFIGTEHILLGLTKSETGIVPKLMQRLGVDSGKVSAEIQKWVGLGQPAPRNPSEIPFTPRAKRALSFAAKEAGALNQTQIGAEHIFLGLLLEGHGVAALVLKSLGVDAEKARQEIRRSLAGA
jgi:ATP-dependent Clp protease ATP-binding subunit ClpC